MNKKLSAIICVSYNHSTHQRHLELELLANSFLSQLASLFLLHFAPCDSEGEYADAVPMDKTAHQNLFLFQTGYQSKLGTRDFHKLLDVAAEHLRQLDGYIDCFLVKEPFQFRVIRKS